LLLTIDVAVGTATLLLAALLLSLAVAVVVDDASPVVVVVGAATSLLLAVPVVVVVVAVAIAAASQVVVAVAVAIAATLLLSPATLLLQPLLLLLLRAATATTAVVLRLTPGMVGLLLVLLLIEVLILILGHSLLLLLLRRLQLLRLLLTLGGILLGVVRLQRILLERLDLAHSHIPDLVAGHIAVDHHVAVVAHNLPLVCLATLDGANGAPLVLDLIDITRFRDETSDLHGLAAIQFWGFWRNLHMLLGRSIHDHGLRGLDFHFGRCTRGARQRRHRLTFDMSGKKYTGKKKKQKITLSLMENAG